MSDESPLDPQAIDALRELSPDAGFLRELIEVYLQDTPERMAELEDAINRNDVQLATRAAHTIKGSSSNFGATQVTRLSHEIEMQGKSGNLAESPASLSKLKAEYSRVAEALAKIAAGS